MVPSHEGSGEPGSSVFSGAPPKSPSHSLAPFLLYQGPDEPRRPMKIAHLVSFAVLPSLLVMPGSGFWHCLFFASHNPLSESLSI